MTTVEHYLVQYGLAAFVGRFVSAIQLSRGDAVVVRSPRGLELAQVLCPAESQFASTWDVAGDVVRLAAEIDHDTDTHLLIRQLLAEAENALADLPLTIVDAEVLLDDSAIIHALPWAACDADPAFAAMSVRFGRPVRLHDLGRTPTAVDPPASAGCGKPGCGTESGGGSCGTGGGCSTGSCSRGAVKSADDLTAYFADLRTKMEADNARVPLH